MWSITVRFEEQQLVHIPIITVFMWLSACCGGRLAETIIIPHNFQAKRVHHRQISQPTTTESWHGGVHRQISQPTTTESWHGGVHRQTSQPTTTESWHGGVHRQTSQPTTTESWHGGVHTECEQTKLSWYVRHSAFGRIRWLSDWLLTSSQSWRSYIQ